jgi:peptide/nickel transport system permease protein
MTDVNLIAEATTGRAATFRSALGWTRHISAAGSFVERAWRRSPGGVCGGAIILLFATVAVFAPVLSPDNPTVGNFSQILKPPLSSGHLLGTDTLGRDVLSRLLWGARPSLVMIVVPIGISVLVGLVLGAFAAVSGWVGRTLVNRGLDVLLGLPPVLLAILVAASIGSGLRNLVIAITVVLVAPMTRVAYQAANVVKSQPYIEAAQAAGARRHQLILGQYIPNMLPPVIAYAASLASLMVVLGAGLSFLGLGIQPPEADWGQMINEGQLVLPTSPWVATIPGLAIFVLAIGCNLLGDSLRDLLDPKMRR